MKHGLILVSILLLTAGLAWAEQEPAVADAGLEATGCVLPDFAGMSEQEMRAAALAVGLGLEPMPMQLPSCPVGFNCEGIDECVTSTSCSTTSLGSRCCTPGFGLQFCCPVGETMEVVRCPCECDGPSCPPTCEANVDESGRCV